jgi:hypothetical protein
MTGEAGQGSRLIGRKPAANEPAAGFVVAVDGTCDLVGYSTGAAEQPPLGGLLGGIA